MALIVDYPSLSQAIVDWAHRQDLEQGQYTDYFIQNAQLKIAKDIIRANFGNGIRVMEIAMQPQTINGGTIPVPSDFYSPKVFEISDLASDQFALTFKEPTWIYDNYPIREDQGMPEYIARDQLPACSFIGTVNAGQLIIASLTGQVEIGMIYAGNGISPGATITGLISGTLGQAGTYSVSNVNDSVSNQSMTGGGEVFIFGPYPDSAYTIEGTYYSKGQPLSDQNATNWMVLACPDLLHAGCMVEAARFLKDVQMFQMWSPVYADGIDALVNQDKGERFSAGTLAVELG